MSSRNATISEGYKSGLTLQELANLNDLSRERIRQILKSNGIGKEHSARTLIVAEKRKATRACLDRRWISRTGFTKSEFDGVSPKIRDQFRHAKANAKARKIEWEFNLKQWLCVWIASGHYEERGRGKYVMARHGDVGAYEEGNVYICTSSQNIKDGYVNKPPLTRAKPAMRLAKKGWSEQNGRFGARLAGKWIGWFGSAKEARKKYLDEFRKSCVK